MAEGVGLSLPANPSSAYILLNRSSLPITPIFHPKASQREITALPPHWSNLRDFAGSVGVATIPNGRVLTTSGAIITQGDYLVEEVSPDALSDKAPKAWAVFFSPNLPAVRRIEETVAVLTIPYSATYYHFLFEVLPRLLLIEASHLPWDKMVVPLDLAFQREAIDLLGLPRDRIIAEHGLHLEAKTLIVPTLPGECERPSNWVCGFLRERFLSRAGSGLRAHRRVYISRRQAARRVLNEAELVETLKQDGFETFVLEELSFLEGVMVFRDAEIIVGAHGSGLANLVFASPGTRVVELFGSDCVLPSYWLLCKEIGATYRYVVGRAVRRSWPEQLWQTEGDILLDIPTVLAAIRSIAVL